MADRCVIIAGGDEERIGDVTDAFVIGCDKGCLYAEKQGIPLDLCVGDFDSYRGPMPEGARVICLPPEKDDTDTLYAVKRALADGFRKITVRCAFGGRLDHTVANLETLVYAAERGAVAEATGNGEFAIAFGPQAGIFRIPRREGYSLSVFAGCGEAREVTIKGTKYEIECETLSGSFPLGVSNEWTADEATVWVNYGTVLIVSSKKEF